MPTTSIIPTVVVNGGAPAYTDCNGVSVSVVGQSSVIEQLQVTFNEAVTLDANAFSIVNLAQAVTVDVGPFPNNLPVTAIQTPVAGSGNTQWIVTFSGAGTNPINGGTGTLIKDGLYMLTTDGSKVHATSGSDMAVSKNAVFWALNGSVVAADNTLKGSQYQVVVDSADFSLFKSTFGSDSDATGKGSIPYNVAFDFNLDGVVDQTDYNIFKSYFGTDWTWNSVIAANTTLSVVHDRNLTIDLSQFSADLNGNQMSFSAGTPNYGTLMTNADGTKTFTPPLGWTGTASFKFTASDNVATSITATVTIAVTDQAPIASAATLVVEYDTQLAFIDLNQYVMDPDGDPLAISVVSGPSHGVLTQNADGTYMETPTPGFVGTDSFTIKANDGVVDSNVATITINVTAGPGNYMGPNDYYYDNNYTVDPATGALRIGGSGVLANDPGSNLTATLLSPTSFGSLTFHSNGTFSYRPNGPRQIYPGADSFTYQATDGTNTYTATVYLSVDEPYHTLAQDSPTGPPAAGANLIFQGPTRYEFLGDGVAFVTNNTCAGDAWAIWWQGPSGMTINENVADWAGVRTGLGGYGDNSLDRIYLSGHGSGTGGVMTQAGRLDNDSLDAATSAEIRRVLRPGGEVVLLGCSQATHEGCQALANNLGCSVVATTGCVSDGNYSASSWYRFYLVVP